MVVAATIKDGYGRGETERTMKGKNECARMNKRSKKDTSLLKADVDVTVGIIFG